MLGPPTSRVENSFRDTPQMVEAVARMKEAPQWPAGQDSAELFAPGTVTVPLRSRRNRHLPAHALFPYRIFSIPASRMTVPHFAISLLIKAANSSGEFVLT
jgi:hypothetical protein